MPPHCDSMDGPVVSAARAALEREQVSLVLPYVPKESERDVSAEVLLEFDRRTLVPAVILAEERSRVLRRDVSPGPLRTSTKIEAIPNRERLRRGRRCMGGRMVARRLASSGNGRQQRKRTYNQQMTTHGPHS